MAERPLRVLYMAHQFFPKFISGTEQYVLALAQAGRAAGDDVRVWAVDPTRRPAGASMAPSRYEFGGVPVTSQPIDFNAFRNEVLADWWNPANAAGFEQTLDEFAPDVVHGFHLRLAGIDRLEQLERRNIPFLLHLMDFWFVCPNYLLLRDEPRLDDEGKRIGIAGQHQCDGPPEGGYGCFDCVHLGPAQWAREPWARGRHAERRAAGEFPADDEAGEQAGFAMVERPRRLAAALDRAARVISPSRTVVAALEKAGVRPARLEVVPYAIDRSLLRDVRAAPTDAVHLGFMGTFAPHKGLAVLLEAFRRVESRPGVPDPGVRLHCFGRFGDFPDYDAKLRAIAAGDGRIEFPGPFKREELARVLGGLHVLVVPSLWRENTPFVCLEARAAGVELVTSDLSGMTECVPEGRGRAFAAGDPAALRAALAAAIADVRDRGHRRLAPDRSIADIGAQYGEFRKRYAAPRISSRS